jgi:regulator of replication initiation timing
MKADFATAARALETRIGQLATDLRSVELGHDRGNAAELETELTALDLELESLRQQYTLEEIRASRVTYRDSH